MPLSMGNFENQANNLFVLMMIGILVVILAAEFTKCFEILGNNGVEGLGGCESLIGGKFEYTGRDKGRSKCEEASWKIGLVGKHVFLS